MTFLKTSILFLLASCFVMGQQLSPIQNFIPLDYDGENQNWAITQGGDKHIYVANNHKLLEFDGVHWRSYSSPNASIFRSVKAKGDKVYTGEYMDFGYWEKGDAGRLAYTSLAKQLTRPMMEDEEFWNIIFVDDIVLFGSLDRLYSYNTQTKVLGLLDVNLTTDHLFKVNDTVYFQDGDNGLMKIEGGRPKQVLASSTFKGMAIIGLYSIDNKLVVVLDNAKLMAVEDGKIEPLEISWHKDLNNLKVYCSARLQDGTLALGTISKGVFFIDLVGDQIKVIDQSKGLNNNTVLSIFQDVDDNVWLGLDNGISVLNINSPFKEYKDNFGRLGLVYASISFGGKLYLGTNQGLFSKPLDQDVPFKLIKGTEGQVWSLTSVDNSLFCGHNAGTFLITGNTAQLISKLPGTWSIKPLKNHPNLLLQGTYDGLSVLSKENGTWNFHHKILGFDISSRFFEVLPNDQIIVNHEYKGLYNLKVDNNFSKVLKMETHSIMGYGSSLVNFQDKLIYGSLDGVFAKDASKFRFEPDTTLIDLFFNQAGGISSILLPDPTSKRLWCFTKKGLSYVGGNSFGSKNTIKTIPIPAFFRRSLGVSGFENISKLKKEEYLIGISNGYVVLDLSKTKKKQFKINLNQISIINDKIDTVNVFVKNKSPIFEYDQNSIRFQYAIPQYDKYSEANYQYRILGESDLWSNWEHKAERSFINLAYGDYTFQVRGKIGNSLTENVASYSFEIKPPWYLSILAFILYLLALISLFIGLHRAYRSYYTKKQNRLLSLEKRKLKRKKLKAKKELVQLKNDKLKSEIESKNRELAVATMSMVKKNEFLNGLKQQLAKVESPSQIKSVIAMINRSIANEDDWKFFEEAFNNADKGFLKKVQKKHPDLTPNDLKLCAYLRLNLSSKEIAPLLNISVRSVEVKRYRLRKKMGLPRENSLTKYIMEL